MRNTKTWKFVLLLFHPLVKWMGVKKQGKRDNRKLIVGIFGAALVVAECAFVVLILQRVLGTVQSNNR